LPKAMVANGCSPACVSAVFSDANELRVSCSCGLSKPYFGRFDATSSTNFVTCSLFSVSIRRWASLALAGALLRLAIVQFSFLRARTTFFPALSIVIRSRMFFSNRTRWRSRRSFGFVSRTDSIFFGSVLEIDGGPVTAFLLRVGYSRAFGARMLRQEVDRQFNSASLPWALAGRVPERGVFRYDPAGGCLVLE